MGFSGGRTEQISSGGDKLTGTAPKISSCRTGIDRAKTQVASGAGDNAVHTAMSRFAAAYGTYTDGIGTEVGALGKLASVSGADIAAATGGRGRVPQPR